MKPTSGRAIVLAQSPWHPRHAAEVERRASMDKEVRKLAKVLREVCKLEECEHLETLQAAKVARKAEVESELESVLGLARARARHELRRERAS
mmetsp:Transcript_23316/g.59410  ORF Transcript_23316/g.59410 Transcript_23316/m.59410 type:complete len:93 (+) Transcript_23316:330-608(+)